MSTQGMVAAPLVAQRFLAPAKCPSRAQPLWGPCGQAGGVCMQPLLLTPNSHSRRPLQSRCPTLLPWSRAVRNGLTGLCYDSRRYWRMEGGRRLPVFTHRHLHTHVHVLPSTLHARLDRVPGRPWQHLSLLCPSRNGNSRHGREPPPLPAWSVDWTLTHLFHSFFSS